MRKRKLKVFEYKLMIKNGKPEYACKENGSLERVLHNRDVDNALKEAKNFVKQLGSVRVIRSVSVCTDGNIHAVVEKTDPKEKELPGWRFQRK